MWIDATEVDLGFDADLVIDFDVVVFGSRGEGFENLGLDADLAPVSSQFIFFCGVALGFLELVLTGFLSLETLISRMTRDAARILHLDAGTLKLGKPADVTIIDLGGTTLVAKEELKSKSFNTPFYGKRLKSKITHTIVDGTIVLENGQLAY